MGWDWKTILPPLLRFGSFFRANILVLGSLIIFSKHIFVGLRSGFLDMRNNRNGMTDIVELNGLHRPKICKDMVA